MKTNTRLLQLALLLLAFSLQPSALADFPPYIAFDTNSFYTKATNAQPFKIIQLQTNALLRGFRVPGFNLASNYVWTATNASTGAGEWRAGGGGGSTVFQMGASNLTHLPLLWGTNLVQLIQGSNTVIYAVETGIVVNAAAGEALWTDDSSYTMLIANTNAFKISPDGAFQSGTNHFAVDGLGNVTLNNYAESLMNQAKNSPTLSLTGSGWSDPHVATRIVTATQQLQPFYNPGWVPGVLYGLNFDSASTVEPGFRIHSLMTSGYMNFILGGPDSVAYSMGTNSDSGFLYINTMGGRPNGTPINEGTFVVPLVYDRTNDVLYTYNAGAWKAIGGSGALATGANPTSRIGLGTTNGSALTFMRSDGSPALDTNIAPNWSALHNFTAALAIPGFNAASNYVWACTNATTGKGEWRTQVGGETNTYSSLAISNATVKPIIGTKTGMDFPFFAIQQGSNTVLFMTTTSLVVNAVPDGGEVNTYSSLAISNATVKPIIGAKTGVDLPFYAIEQGSNTVLFMTTTSLVVNAVPDGTGTIINTADGYMPVRGSATTFTNSPFYVVTSNAAIDSALIFGPGTTNALQRSGAGLLYTNGLVGNVQLEIRNGAAADSIVYLGVNSGAQAFIKAPTGRAITFLPNNGASQLTLSSSGSLLPATTITLGSSGNSFNGLFTSNNIVATISNLVAVGAGTLPLASVNTRNLAFNGTLPVRFSDAYGFTLAAADLNTSAGTTTTTNSMAGRVRLASGNTTYYVTNNIATTSSLVLATVNSADAVALSVQAVPTAGLLTLTVPTATADTDITWMIIKP